MDKAAILAFAGSMFAILNPIGSVAIFASMTSNRSKVERNSIAIRSSIAIAVILIVTIWLGEAILGAFNVGISSLQAAGGLMIAMISLSMLQSQQSSIHDTKDSDEEAESPKQDIAVVPLALPMIAGPGAMVTVILSTHQYKGVMPNIEMSVVCIILAILIGIGFFASGPIIRFIGTKGLDVITKIMGMILLAIAISMLAGGLTDLFPVLGMTPVG